MGIMADLAGTLDTLFRFGLSGVGARTTSSVLEIRNAANSGFADVTLKNVGLSGFQANSRVFGVRRRQVVSRGAIDAAGLPNIVTTTSGLNCQINASTTSPIVCEFAAGFDQPSSTIPVPMMVDYTGYYDTNQSYSGLTANTTHYFYFERNTSTGALTPTRITIAPIYARTAPSSPATGQHWFKTSQDSLSTQPGMTMYEWSGSAWVARQRVFVGEVTTGGSAVSSIANYAYNRQYQSDWASYSGQQTINFAHNLGMTFDSGVAWSVVARTNSSDAGVSLTFGTLDPAGSTNYGVYAYGAGSRLSQPFSVGGGGGYWNGSGWVTTGQILVSISSVW